MRPVQIKVEFYQSVRIGSPDWQSGLAVRIGSPDWQFGLAVRIGSSDWQFGLAPEEPDVYSSFPISPALRQERNYAVLLYTFRASGAELPDH